MYLLKAKDFSRLTVSLVILSQILYSFTLLSTNPRKWSTTLKQFFGKNQRIVWQCLTILWGSRLKGLTSCLHLPKHFVKVKKKFYFFEVKNIFQHRLYFIYNPIQRRIQNPVKRLTWYFFTKSIFANNSIVDVWQGFEYSSTIHGVWKSWNVTHTHTKKKK